MITENVTFSQALQLTENDSFQNHSWSHDRYPWEDLCNPKVFGDYLIESIAIKWSNSTEYTVIYSVRDSKDSSQIHVLKLNQKFKYPFEIYEICPLLYNNFGTLVVLD